MTDDDMKAHFESEGYLHVRKIEDGWAGVFRFIHTWGICTEMDMTGYRRRYCYTSEVHAASELAGMKSLSDVPEGWLRRLPEAHFFTIGGYEGAPFVIGQCMSERDIINNAQFSQHIDQPEGQPVMDKPSPENMKRAMELLNREGRVMEFFNTQTEANAFVARAEELGLGKEAQGVVDAW